MRLLLTVQWIGGGRRKGTQEGLSNTGPNSNSACALGDAILSIQGGGRHFTVPLDGKVTTVLKNHCYSPKYLCLACAFEHCAHFHNQDAAWLWPVGVIKPDLQILPGKWTSCLEELLNPQQKVQHAARMPSAEHTSRYTPGPSGLIKKPGKG